MNLRWLWKKKQNNIGFPIFKENQIYFMTDTIFHGYDIWLLGYSIYFSCLYFLQGHSTVWLQMIMYFIFYFERKSTFKTRSTRQYKCTSTYSWTIVIDQLGVQVIVLKKQWTLPRIHGTENITSSAGVWFMFYQCM